jgi:hypothetical protein
MDEWMDTRTHTHIYKAIRSARSDNLEGDRRRRVRHVLLLLKSLLVPFGASFLFVGLEVR